MRSMVAASGVLSAGVSAIPRKIDAIPLICVPHQVKGARIAYRPFGFVADPDQDSPYPAITRGKGTVDSQQSGDAF